MESEERCHGTMGKSMTRRDLLKKLEDVSCYKDDLEKLQELIDAEDSDLFDVLEYIAYAKSPISRSLVL